MWATAESPKCHVRKTSSTTSQLKSSRNVQVSPRIVEGLVDDRNKACHDTEFVFASLPLLGQFKGPVLVQKCGYDHWARLLLWVTIYINLKDVAGVANKIEPPSIGTS